MVREYKTIFNELLLQYYGTEQYIQCVITVVLEHKTM